MVNFALVVINSNHLLIISEAVNLLVEELAVLQLILLLEELEVEEDVPRH